MDLGRAERRGEKEAVVETALTRLGSRRSAWNAADARGEVEKLIASTGVVVDGAVRRELAEDLAARVVEASRPLLGRDDVPEHVRSLSSPLVLAVERELVARIADRADAGTISVVEGAAGSGKTRRLGAMRAQVESRGGRMLVVSPTRKAAQVAAGEVGADTDSVARLLYQHGYRWDSDGRWGWVAAAAPGAPQLNRRTHLVVDEAGMIDQDTARALLELADDAGSEVTLIGDRHQLPAVGRGECSTSRPATHPIVSSSSRASAASPIPRTPTCRSRCAVVSEPVVYDELVRRGLVVVHASEVERTTTLAARAVRGELVVADTREQVAQINGLAHQVRVTTGEVTGGQLITTGEQIGIGDRIATRRNDTDIGVANRELWTVVGSQHGALEVVGEAGCRTLPVEYAVEHIELAYATTAYGAQGSTVPTSHVLVGEHTGAASAYVGMTRGRERNVAHLVADSTDNARSQWIAVFGRDRADLGPTDAAERAADAIDRYGPTARTRRPAPQPAEPRPVRPSVPAYDYRTPSQTRGPIGF